MNRFALTGLALLATAQADAETIALVHAHTWTLTNDTLVHNATIIITDGKIVSVAENGAAPSGARVVDVAGRIVTPGLMHAATQLGLLEVNAASETVDHTAKPAVPGSPGAGFDVQYAVNANSMLISLARADGLTRALAYPGGSALPPFNGSASLLHLRERADIVEAPRVAVFATVGNRSAAASYGSRAVQWQLLRNALDAARIAAALPPAAGAPPRPADAAALDTVITGKVPLAIATHRASDLRQAVRLTRDYGIRVVILGGAEGWMVAGELAAAKIPVILDPMANLPISFDELGSRLDNAALLQRAGVVVALSLGGVQSYNAGSSLREGAGLAVANGLPYIEGLRSIISRPAEIWGVADRHGTIAPGRDADLVVWDGDPLEPATNVVTVLIQGAEVSLRTHQRELSERYLPAIKAAAGGR